MLLFGGIGLVLIAIGLGIGLYLAVLWQRGTLNPGRPLFTIVVLAILGGIQLLSLGFIGTQLVALRKEVYKVQRESRLLRREFRQGVEEGIELTGKVVVDKLTDLVSLTGFAGGGLLLSGSPPACTAGLVLLIGVVLAAALSLLARKVAQGQGNAGWRRWPWLERFRISGVLDGMAAIRPAQLGVNVCLSILGFVVFYSQAFVMLRAFWPTASWEVVPYFPIITLSTILPIGIGGVGVREWTAVLLLRQFAIPEAVAFNTFFSHFVIVQVLPFLVGAYVIATFRPMPTENAA
jgi:hypothetical protein